MDVSVVVPLYNEEESLPVLYRAIGDALADTNLDYEIIFVDDGSRDETFRIAAEIAESDARLRVIKFRRNYG